MSGTKTQWTKPQLIVLAKGTPEESVLTNCKTMNPNQPFSGPTDPVAQDTCASGTATNCSPCQSRGLGAS